MTNVFKAFDCNLYDGSQLVEVNGTLILENCLNLDVDFPVLKKIAGSRQGAALIVAASSSLPSLEFLKRIEITFMLKKIVVPYKPASKAFMEIRSKVREWDHFKPLSSSISDDHPPISDLEIHL